MTENMENLVLEQLVEFHTLGSRMSALEQHMAALLAQIPQVWEEIAGIKRRIERIERRLELTDQGGPALIPSFSG